MSSGYQSSSYESRNAKPYQTGASYSSTSQSGTNYPPSSQQQGGSGYQSTTYQYQSGNSSQGGTSYQPGTQGPTPTSYQPQGTTSYQPGTQGQSSNFSSSTFNTYKKQWNQQIQDITSTIIYLSHYFNQYFIQC